MDIFQAVILGIVEGITEFLPISSTAHLTFTSVLLGLEQSDYVKTFEIAIQSGAIFAVIALYWRKFFDMEMLKRILIAFIPTAIIGFLFYSLIKTYLIGNILVSLLALGIGGVIMIFLERRYPRSSDTFERTIDIKTALMIGLCQSFAMIPGVSRSAATIFGGMALGISRSAIVEFSFLLAVPTMVAATGLDVIKNYHLFSSSEIISLGIGFFAAFVAALIAIRFLLGYIQKHSFVSFGMYRIIFSILLALVLYG